MNPKRKWPWLAFKAVVGRASPRALPRWLAFLAAVGAAAQTGAQQRYRTVEEPRWLTFRLREASLGAYSEGTFEETVFRNSGTSVAHDRLFVGPTLGLNFDGSVYHPNLFRYQVASEGAYGEARDTVTTASGTRSRNEQQYLGRFHGSANLLANKPYTVNFFGDYDRSYRDYDFFNRVTVDSWRYGARVAYDLKPFYLSANYTHRDEDVTGFDIPSTTHEDVVGFDARHDRTKGSSTFNYTFNQYSRVDVGRVGEGTDHTVSLADSETFGSRDRFKLNTRAAYNRREAIFESSDQLTTGGTLQVDHRDNLSSFYDVSYDRYKTGEFTSDNYAGRGELRHQLYSSLTSTLIVQAADFEGSDSVNSGYTRRFGGGFAENYTKRIGADHRLTMNNSLLVDHVDQKGISTVQNESHSFSTGLGGAPPDSFFLNLPNVVESSIEVTDQNDTPPPYLRGLDYIVIRNGARTVIQRPAGSRIPAGATVLVDYEAEPTPEGSYEGLSEIFQIRVDLWNNLWGVYARLNLFANNAPEQLRVQNLRSYTFGTDLTWRWLRAGAEYEIYDSDQSQYRSARLFQSLSFRPEESSSLGLEFTESWTDYVDANRQDQNYRSILRYHRSLTYHIEMDLEGGAALRRGRDVDQTLATSRLGVDYVIGKLRVKFGYEYQYELFLQSEQRTKHMFFIRVKRVF